MEPVLLYFDQDGFNEHINRYSGCFEQLNNVFAAYKATGLKQLINAEFKELFINAPGLVFDKMTEGQPVIVGGFKVDRAKAMDILIKPEGYEHLIYLSENYNKQMYADYVLSNTEISNDSIVYSEAFLKKEKKIYEIWADTEMSLKGLEFINKVRDLATEMFGEDEISIPLAVSSMLSYRNVGTIPIAGVSFVHKHFLNPNGIKYFNGHTVEKVGHNVSRIDIA